MFLKSILLIVLLIIITSSESIDEQFLSKKKKYLRTKYQNIVQIITNILKILKLI